MQLLYKLQFVLLCKFPAKHTKRQLSVPVLLCFPPKTGFLASVDPTFFTIFRPKGIFLCIDYKKL